MVYLKIYNGIEEFAKTGYECHAALGFFDGVHLGHRAVIRDCVENKGDKLAAVLTFRESPAKLLGKGDIRLLTDNDRKAELIASLGVDALIFADFSRVRDMEAGEFITRVLHEQLRAKRVVCGYNYRFGRRGAGDTALLYEKCGGLGIEVAVREPVDIDGKPASSSAVRELLQSGGIEEANRMLGYDYAIGGRIGKGNHLGEGMGFPTVNIPIGEGLAVPRFGVYDSRVTVGGGTYRAATNIGVHPTVGENDAPLCESFLLDYRGGELYGEKAVCALRSFIRPEMKFASEDVLIAQVQKDIAKIAGR